jgi:hypothetical protein
MMRWLILAGVGGLLLTDGVRAVPLPDHMDESAAAEEGGWN